MHTSDSAVDDVDNASPSILAVDRDLHDDGIESSRHLMGYDELHEILSWMPAKSAIKYSSSLCKWLCNIHKEPRFIQKQCIRSLGQDNAFFLQHVFRNYRRGLKKKEFHVLPRVNVSAFGIPYESLDYLSNYGRILSSSNGLLLLGTHSFNGTGSFEFRVCNPATREWSPLPTPEGFKFLVDEDSSPLIECFPWGHDPLDNIVFPNDYIIALPVEPEHAWQINQKNHKQQLLIYCNGRWEEELCDVSIEGRILSYDTPVAFFLDTTKRLVVHYLCNSDMPETDEPPDDDDDLLPSFRRRPSYMEPYIAAFDIREKKLLRQIKLPEGAWTASIVNRRGGTHKKMWISKWNETSIILVKWYLYCGSIEAWVLDDYGCEGESWRLVMRKSEMGLWSNNKLQWTMSVGVASGRGLLIQTTLRLGSRVFLYVVEGEGQGRLELVGDPDHLFKCEPVAFIPYANTLRPVSVQNAETQSIRLPEIRETGLEHILDW